MVIIPKLRRKLIVETLIAATAPLDAVLVGLYKEPLEPSPTRVLADYTAIEAAFVGYVRSGVIVWGDVFFDANETAIVVGDVKQFLAGAIVDAETIYGAFWVKGALLVGVEEFDEPIPITGEFDAAVYTPQFSFGQ